MLEIKWPVTKCEACGFDLREATPKANEKGVDASGRLIWTDFCPQCGHGYNVGDRVLPVPSAEVLAEMAAKPVLSYVKDEKMERTQAGKPSGVPPDKRGAALAEENPDPEGLINKEPQPPAEDKVEPGAIRPPGEGEYFCTRCASVHRLTSKVGMRHLKYKE